VFLYLLSFTIAHYRGLSLTIAAQRSAAKRSAAVVEMPLKTVMLVMEGTCTELRRVREDITLELVNNVENKLSFGDVVDGVGELA